ncbi:MAG: hypothetical protein ACFB51_11745 [Anaerolineae bacterium]
MIRHYTEIYRQETLSRFSMEFAGFRSAVMTELRFSTTAHYTSDGLMMIKQENAQAVVQTASGSAVELVFHLIERVEIKQMGPFSGGTITLSGDDEENIRATVVFDGLMVICERLFYRHRPEWQPGRFSRLRGEIPTPEAIEAYLQDDDWRECSECAEAWFDPEEFSYCPECGSLTQLYVDG